MCVEYISSSVLLYTSVWSFRVRFYLFQRGVPLLTKILFFSIELCFQLEIMVFSVSVSFLIRDYGSFPIGIYESFPIGVCESFPIEVCFSPIWFLCITMTRAREILILNFCASEKEKKYVKEVNDWLEGIEAIIWGDSDLQVSLWHVLYQLSLSSFIIPCILPLID